MLLTHRDASNRYWPMRLALHYSGTRTLEKVKIYTCPECRVDGEDIFAVAVVEFIRRGKAEREVFEYCAKCFFSYILPDQVNDYISFICIVLYDAIALS